VVQQIVCYTEHLAGKSSSLPLIEGKLHHMSAAPRADADARPDQGSACGGVLKNDLGWALGVVFRSYLKAANAAFADVPGGPRGYQVLAAATRGEPESQLALAQHLGVDRTVMTYLLDDLESAGLIERRPDPADRRARRITATPAGTRLAGQLDRRLRAAEERLLASLSSDGERQSFRALLRQLAADISASDPATSACTEQPESC
jgi:DNA-binding MarR family transcriptional regulator